MPATESGVLRMLLPRTRGKNVKLLRRIHREFIAAWSPRAVESQQTVHLRDAFVYTGEAPFRGSGKKGKDCWDNRRAPNKEADLLDPYTTALRSQNSQVAKFTYGVNFGEFLFQALR